MTIKYSEDHEWIELTEDGLVTVGITEFAQEQLGDLVFIELPDVSDEVSQGDNICVIESVKAASDLIAPVSGEIVSVNDRLNDEPELASEDPLVEGWFVKIKLSDISEFDALMDEAAYQEFIEE
ncbi:MAG TPA: glycine cleavage system protein GcvH [Candidatus Thioglobus sp.]|jgi:glycine cleavage system H protein|nr:glycine cleavage system protein GcvH [Candidatus Thioglobus sp.]HIL20653.1 glycine cleavage system protein GcvH [Candidatus Thioglobus sp.]